MKLYHKINNYLLYNHPNIWVTRIHLFLPIGLIILFGILCVNTLVFPCNLEKPLSSGDEGFWLMVIPVLIYLVYWFIFQARYNVEKSGGKLSVLQEYINYFIYFTVYSLALLLVLAIPLSNDYKVMTSISESEYRDDMDALNKGNSVVNKLGTLTKEGNLYSYQTSNYVYDYGNYNYNNSHENIEVNEQKLIQIINQYKIAFNKYTKEKIKTSSRQIIKENLQAYDGYAYEDYEYYDRYPYNDSPKYKLEQIGRLKNKGFLFKDKEAMQAFSMLIALCALITWIFKQIHWKEFVFGLIAIALTPLIIGIIGLVMFSMFRVDDEIGLWLVLFAYTMAIIFVIKGFTEKVKSKFTIITTIYLHFFLPLIPIFIYALYVNLLRNDTHDTIFSIGWIIGLLSIGVFKILYKRYRFLPSKK